MRWPVALGSAGVLLLGAGCSDEALNQLTPTLEVEPEAVDFGAGIVDRDNRFELTVRNGGTAQLEISEVVAEPADGIFAAGEFPSEVRPRGEGPLFAIFAPKAPREAYQGRLIIRSNDPRRPEVIVPLEGVGGIREIAVVPESVDFGVVNEGTAPVRTVEIRNEGGDPLIIDGLTWTSTSVDLGPTRPLPARIEVMPLTSTVVELTYSPVDLGSDRGVLAIESNDEDEPVVEVPVTGTANLAPRAVAWLCDKVPGEVGCDGSEKRRSTSAALSRLLGLDGLESFDPEGDTLTDFEWRPVEHPAGHRPVLFFSSEDINQRDRATGEMQVDFVGRYVLRLVVQDERGLESLDTPESRVSVLPRDLEVYLRWDIATDLDLHLVRPGGRVGDYGSGRAGTSTGTDCSTFNRRPNWGDSMTEADDPSLDRDVVTGTGPEVVSLDFPETSGPYVAYAHYCDSRGQNVNANAWVEVYARGELIERVPVMDGRQRLLPGELWEAASISWDPANQTATVIAGATPPTARPDLCILP